MTDYRVQFPVMRQYERDTWYDATGRITFTASKGLVGAGLPRKAGRNDATCRLRFPDGKTRANRLGWEDVQPKDGKSQVPDGTAIERPIIDDTLPGGPVRRTIQYVAPFSLADREEDYRTAWAHFASRCHQPGRTAYNMTSLVRLGESPMEHWQLQEAKARMSELVKRAQAAPQGITLHGKPVAVVVSQATFDTLSQAKGSLLDFMQASPLAGSDEPAFERERERSRTRRVPRL